MGRSNRASFEIVTGNLVEEFNGVPFEFFNGVNFSLFRATRYSK
jgi:hypothetical protein